VTTSDLTIKELKYGGKLMPWAAYVIAGNIVFLSGAEGRDPSKEQEYPDGTPAPAPMFASIEDQTQACLQKIVERVKDAGAKLENLAMFNFTLRNRTDWPVVQRVWTEFWDEHCPDINDRPRAAGIFITDVMMDRNEMLIDIWAIAYRP
jgi:enamine deaminase RidA (YjgF/YER057c/UK114 family)